MNDDSLIKTLSLLALIPGQVRGCIALEEHHRSENLNANLNALTLLKGPSFQNQ